MKKVLVIGSGGAGKSTVARRLGEALRVEVVHLDALYWHAGWVETPKDVWRERVARLLEGDSWILDGNYSGTLDLRLEACDTVIFLDLPRTLCLWRILKRLVAYRAGGRPDMAAGCREKLNPEFLRWVWGYPRRTRPKVLKLLRDHAGGKTVFHLRTQSEIENLLAQARAARAERPAPAERPAR
jgi:adenylate kinase family enzyme